MNSKNKIGIWGQFGDGGLISDGQAVRTTIITNEMKMRYGEDKLFVVNTNNWKKHSLSLFLNTLKMNATCKKIVIFPADNGFKVVVPIFNFMNRIFKRQIYEVVIGGFLPGLLETKPKYVGMLKKYTALFVQTANIKKDLEKFGLENIKILSNPKRLKRRTASEVFANYKKEIKVCTLSRVNKVKGIGDAILAVKRANEQLGGFITLDIYGMVASEYKEHFDVLLSENSEFVSYAGVLNYDKTSETLQNYFAMLFPTYYYGEGFPGNVVDAYNAGIPIIATDWLYNKDVITDGKNGILVPIHNPEAISEALLILYRDRNFHNLICLNNIKEAEQYQPESVLKEFYRYMDK